MYKIAFISTLLFAASASAAERCGTDSFGNTVCMDKDGVLATVPAERGKKVNGQDSTSSGSADESGSKGAREDRKRCGVDPFGNKVCASF